jgi:hypothetical protein
VPISGSTVAHSVMVLVVVMVLWPLPWLGSGALLALLDPQWVGTRVSACQALAAVG